MRARILSTWPAVLAAAATVLAFRNALSRSFVLYHRDLGLLISPVIAEARRASGKAVDLLPLWTHMSAEGRPLAANPGYSFLSPFALLWALCDHAVAFDLFLIAHAVLAAVGASVLARRLGASRTASFAAGCFLGLGGGVVSATDLWWAAVALGWAPWVLAAGTAAAEHLTPRRLALLALALALQADGGMPEVVLCTLFVGFLLSFAVAEGAWVRRAGRTALVWGGAGAWAVALCAPQLAPAAIVARSTIRGAGFVAKGVLFNSLDPRALPGLIWPGWGGSPIDRLVPGAFPGAAWTDTGTPYLLSPYCGIACVVLALIGIAAARRRAVAVALAVAAALGIVAALGRHLPGVETLVTALAPLPLRYPVKALFAPFLALPILAALGLDALVAAVRDPRFRGWLALILAAAGGADLLIVHRTFFPVIERSALQVPPLAHRLQARARALGVANGQWRVHHQRFPEREWGPPPAIERTEEAIFTWQTRMLMPPTGMPHGMHHAFDRLPDQLDDLRHLEETRQVYALPVEDWARRLGGTGVLFVISPITDLEEKSGHVLEKETDIGPEFGVPAGSGVVYRDLSFEPRIRFANAAQDDASVVSITEDHRGLTLQLATKVNARLLVHDDFGDLAAWTARARHGAAGDDASEAAGESKGHEGGDRPIALHRSGTWFADMVIDAGESSVRLEYRPPAWRASMAAMLIASALALVAIWRGGGVLKPPVGIRAR